MAVTALGKSVLGTKSKISGANLFLRLNYWVVYCDGPVMAKRDAKCGALSADSLKVFFKYFYVNTATGEKSGDVLAQAKLSE